MSNRIVDLVMWTGLGLVCGACISIIWYSGSTAATSTTGGGADVTSAQSPMDSQSDSGPTESATTESGIEATDRASGAVDPSLASPDFSPEQVVRMQLASLKAGGDDVDQLRVCYSLASPGNREMVGPFDRFVAMLQRDPSFRPMLNHKGSAVGKTVFPTDSTAVMLVTVIDEKQVGHGYWFCLVEQTAPPYLGCYMTTAVIPVPSIDDTSAAAPDPGAFIDES
tara:strand:+ start:772278 stop:772949 length:672 start_codon:yes stop_codon:yes gene_type:complete